MQLTEETAEQTAAEIGYSNFSFDAAFLPEVNVDIGCFYFEKLLTRRGGNVNLALASYNAGPGNVANWLDSGIIDSDCADAEKIPFRETRDFVKKVRFCEKIYNFYIAVRLNKATCPLDVR